MVENGIRIKNAGAFQIHMEHLEKNLKIFERESLGYSYLFFVQEKQDDILGNSKYPSMSSIGHQERGGIRRLLDEARSPKTEGLIAKKGGMLGNNFAFFSLVSVECLPWPKGLGHDLVL